MPSIKATTFLILAVSGALAQQYGQFYARDHEQDLYARDLNEFYGREALENDLYARDYEQDLYARDLNDFYSREALENDLYARDFDGLYARHLEQDLYSRSLQALKARRSPPGTK
jgi:sulfur transfer complex TusBCD TusB component (DsrH family)